MAKKETRFLSCPSHLISRLSRLPFFIMTTFTLAGLTSVKPHTCLSVHQHKNVVLIDKSKVDMEKEEAMLMVTNIETMTMEVISNI